MINHRRLSLMAVGTAFLLLSLIPLTVYAAFTNGQNASTVIGQSDFTTGTPTTTQSGLHSPFGLTIDPSGNLWVVDGFNNRVLEFVPPFTTGMAANLVIGQSDFTTDTATTTQSGLWWPYGLAFDASGNLWVADMDNARVLEFVPPFTTGMAASLVIGQSSFTTRDRVTTQSGFRNPFGLACDASGNLWVADGGNNRVLEFIAPFSDGMAASLVIGQSDFTTRTIATTQNGLWAPYYLAFDASGNLWVADGLNNRVLEFVPPFSDGMAASLVIGQSDFTSRTFATTQSGLSGPYGLAFDPSDNLWVVDSSNARVLEFVPPFTTGMAANLVIGQSDFTTSTIATTQSGLWEPHDLAFDASGNLWVADGGNSRVLEYSVVPVIPVVPEVPFGTVIACSSMLIALVGFAGFRRFRPKLQPQKINKA
jgi:sugar lactone lactonase YvrE